MVRFCQTSLLLAALISACVPGAPSGPGAGPPATTTPAFSGDPCALHLAEGPCRADATHRCTWATTCRSVDAGTEGGTTAAACTCPAGLTCVARLGGTVSLSVDAVTCASLRPGCTPTGPCTCLAGQGKCLPSETVADLCLCDDLRQ